MKNSAWIVAITFFLFSFNQDEGQTLIYWTSGTPLQWSDFSGVVDSTSEFDAWTYSGITYEYTWQTADEQIILESSCESFFDPAQSWVKREKISDELLAHEQLHFDLSELYSRYLQATLSTFTFTDRVDAEVDSIYEAHLNALLAAQIQYDQETDHFNNIRQQAMWTQKVKSELKRLD